MVQFYQTILIGFLVLLATTNRVLSAPEEDDLSNFLRKSIHAAQTLSFDGTLCFRSMIPGATDKVFTSRMQLCRNSSGVQKMVSLEPELIKNHIIAKIDDAIWVTPLNREELDRLRQLMPVPPHYWFRLFRHLTEAIPEEDTDLFLQNYNLSKETTGPVARRNVIAINAQTKYTSKYVKRPSIRIWIDCKTLMPLKYERFDYDKVWYETLEFENIQIDENIQDCVVDTTVLKKLSSPSEPNEEMEEVVLDFTPLQPERLPQGFQQAFINKFRDTEKNHVILETHYKDGLSHFSTFQRRQTPEEKEKQDQEPEEERNKPRKSKEFGKDVYFRELAGIRIFVIGNIYPDTMKFILSQIKPAPPQK